MTGIGAAIESDHSPADAKWQIAGRKMPDARCRMPDAE